MDGREFPEGANEWSDPVSRRHFVKIMSASFLLAVSELAEAAAGGRNSEFAVQQDAGELCPWGAAILRHGDATRGSAVPLVVKSNDGRPDQG